MKIFMVLTVALIAIQAISARAADITVDQLGQKFNPDTISLKVGDTLLMTNKETAGTTHNAQVINAAGDTDDKGLQKPGGAPMTQKFDKAGEYQVRCGIHPKMKLTVSVQ